jgi:hypothetical protein
MIRLWIFISSLSLSLLDGRPFSARRYFGYEKRGLDLYSLFAFFTCLPCIFDLRSSLAPSVRLEGVWRLFLSFRTAAVFTAS